MNILCIIHDASVDRVSDGSGLVADMLLAEIKNCIVLRSKKYRLSRKFWIVAMAESTFRLN